MRNESRKEIDIQEYVPINGIDQFLYHLGTRYENPVLLYLHGGPGSAESLIAYLFQEEWEKSFTVVHWDQRGAGKTLTKNPDRLPTIDLMLQDLYEVILEEKISQTKDCFTRPFLGKRFRNNVYPETSGRYCLLHRDRPGNQHARKRTGWLR